jgi:hypothetical protein
MWRNVGAVRWLYVCMSLFLYQKDSGLVGFVEVWGGLCECCVLR